MADARRTDAAGKVTPVIDRRYPLRKFRRRSANSNRPRPRESHHQHRFLREPPCRKRHSALVASSARCCWRSSSSRFWSTSLLLGPVISQPPGWIVNAAAEPLTVEHVRPAGARRRCDLACDRGRRLSPVCARELADSGRLRGTHKHRARAFRRREQPIADVALAEPDMRRRAQRSVNRSKHFASCSARHAIGRTTRT